MITGSVQPGGDAIVTVRIRGPRGAIIDVQTVVDTGFNDWLTLPATGINSLVLQFREEGRYTLADGSQTISRLFEAEIDWMGSWRRLLIVEMDGDPLLGMAMLRGSHLSVEVIDGGRVEIRPLT